MGPRASRLTPKQPRGAAMSTRCPPEIPTCESVKARIEPQPNHESCQTRNPKKTNYPASMPSPSPVSKMPPITQITKRFGYLGYFHPAARGL
jgi:hypothetical protein